MPLADFIDWSNTVGAGSVVTAAVVAIIGGFFAIRTNIARIWRETAEGYKAELEARTMEWTSERSRLTVLWEDERKHLLEEVVEQRDAKHDMANQLQAEKLKTDLTSVLKTMQNHHETIIRQLVQSQAGAAERAELLRARVETTERRVLEEFDKRFDEQVTVLKGISEAMERIARS